MELTCKWITLANRYYYMYLAKALAPYGINTSQYLFIAVLCREPGITQDKLPERIGINKSNVTRVLEAYPHIMKVVAEWDAATTSMFSEEEKQTLQALLRRLAQSAREYRGQGEARTGGEVEEG